MSSKPNVQWCDRAIIVSPIRYALCTSEAAFHAELRRLEIPTHEWPQFVTPGKDATTHHFEETSERHALAIVCLGSTEGHTPVGIAALLVHEAVHVWQEICERMGEHNPSREFEAYSVQWLSQELMDAYAKTLEVA